MIKFWKSAAKGKTGCPVRPPESDSARGTDTDVKIFLDIQTLEENRDNQCIFQNKSKLSLNLRDILIEKKSLNYFLQYMESICKRMLVDCWLELDNFRTLLSKGTIHNEIDNHSKIGRTKSFDFQCKCNSPASQRFSWRGSSSFDNSSNFKLRKNESAVTSCINLAEQAKFKCEACESNLKSPTEVAINLFKTYVALEAPYQIDLPDGLRKSVISNICQPEGQIQEDCFRPVQDIVFKQIETSYFSGFMDSPFYIKAQIDMLTSGSLKLEDILYNESVLFYFTEYLEQEGCSVLLEFLMAVTHFRDNLLNGNTTNPEQAQADAIVLYEKYFSLQATKPVGFPTDIRLQIESDICREGGPLATCFDLPYKIVFNTLSRYVKTFLESELYYKYLTEMVHSVEQMCTNQKAHSDCSSEFSVSTQNTLLAMGDPVFRKKKRNHSVPDMTIDSNQLYNADALWQRKKNEGLSLGRVNSLGRFESKFEPDPDKKGKSVLKKMVSRFVPTNASKVEEEMAWQIAHMIVKDVTDLTMAPPDNEEE